MCKTEKQLIVHNKRVDIPDINLVSSEYISNHH